jgi:hypothetical protein
MLESSPERVANLDVLGVLHQPPRDRHDAITFGRVGYELLKVVRVAFLVADDTVTIDDATRDDHDLPGPLATFLRRQRKEQSEGRWRSGTSGASSTTGSGDR